MGNFLRWEWWLFDRVCPLSGDPAGGQGGAGQDHTAIYMDDMPDRSAMIESLGYAPEWWPENIVVIDNG